MMRKKVDSKWYLLILFSTTVDNAMGKMTGITATAMAHILMPDVC